MKITKILTYKHKLLKLKLINTKIYKKNQKNFIKIEDISIRLKKALHIIYKYHVNNKRILFVGTPLNMDKKFLDLIKNSNHILIPELVWINGIIANQKACFKYLSKNQKTINNKISEILFQLKKKSDLIVILNPLKNFEALNESYTAKMPVISLNCNLNISNFKSSYKIPGNFKFTKKKIRDVFFYSILIAIFKKANKSLKLKIKQKKPKYKNVV